MTTPIPIPEPHYAVSELSLPANTFQEDVEQIARSRATGIGLWEGKLDAVTDDDAVQALRDNHLTATLCLPRVWSVFPNSRFPHPATPAERVEAMADSIRRLARFDPVAVMVTPGASGDVDDIEAKAIMTSALRELSSVAAEVGTRIALEPIRRENGGFIATFADAARYIDDIGAENLGIALDIWHLWDEPTLYDLIRTRPELVYAVQVNDWRDPTRVQSDRVLPGDGIARVSTVIAELIRAGFDGWYELELMSDLSLPDSLWRLAPDEFLERGDAKFDAVWSEAVTSVHRGSAPEVRS